MRKPLALSVTACLLTGLGASVTAVAASSESSAQAAGTRQVVLGDNFFKPAKMTVRKNTILKFYWGPDNEGTNVEHNVTGVRGNKFETEDTVRPERPFRKRITRNTSIVCTIHPTTMKLKVTVK